MTQNQDAGKARSWLRVAIVGRNPRTTLVRALILAAACAVLFRYILLPVRVTGISMESTYRDRGVNFINTLAYLRHEPQRTDVVGIRSTPSGDGSSTPHLMYLKRIVGLPGETISFRNGRLIIDGEPLDETYVKGPCDWNYPATKLGRTEYFAVGDNRSMPVEDQVFGKVDRSRIVGKVLL